MRSGRFSWGCMSLRVLAEADAVAIGIDDVDLPHAVRLHVHWSAVDGNAALFQRGDLGGEIFEPDVHVPHAVRAVRLRFRRPLGEREHQFEAVAMHHGETRRLTPYTRLPESQFPAIEVDGALQ